MNKKNLTEKGGEQVTMQTVVMMQNVALVHLIAGQEELFKSLNYDERRWPANERRTLPAGFVLRLMEHGLPLKPHTPNDGSYERYWNPQPPVLQNNAEYIATLGEQFKAGKWQRVKFQNQSSLGGELVLEHDTLGYPLTVYVDEIRVYPVSMLDKLTLPYEKVAGIDPVLEKLQRTFIKYHKQDRAKRLQIRKRSDAFAAACAEADKLDHARFEALGEGEYEKAIKLEREARNIWLDYKEN